MSAHLDKITQKIRKKLSMLLGKEYEEIDHSALLADLGVDSLTLVELFVFIEQEFGINLMESGFQQEDMKTVSSLSSRIARETEKPDSP